MRIRQHVKAAIVFASVVGILLSLPVLAARRENIALNVTQEAKPAPEMEKLNFYLGEWDYTQTDAKSPNGPKSTGVYSSKLGPGGNSLINTFHLRGQGPLGDSDGLVVITWDPKEKVYKSYVFASFSPGARVSTGAFEGDALVLRSEITAQGNTLKFRGSTRVTEPGKLVTEQFMTREDEPETLLFRVEAKKR